MFSVRLIAAICVIAGSVPAVAGAAAPPPPHLPAFPIYRFQGQPNDGAAPSGGLIRDSQGRLYGATQAGGAMNQGTIYRLTTHPGGKATEETLYSFSGPDGSAPNGPLTLDASGNVYGVTSLGGANSSGTAFRLTDTNGVWVHTTLHSFGAGQDGVGLITGMTFGSNGNLFGVTEAGGSTNSGTAFELSPKGDTVYYAKIHDFGMGTDGSGPISGLVVFKDSFVGTTPFGGTSIGGVVFTLSPASGGRWREHVVYNFDATGTDVAGPVSPQGFASDHKGGFIGCGSGASANKGGVFRIKPSGTTGAPWMETVLYAFGQNPSDPIEKCDLVEGPSSVIYGTSPYGGGALKPEGVLFTLSPPGHGNPNWTETNLINFSPNAFLGSSPAGAVVRQDRVFYGVSAASRFGDGLNFVFKPPAAP